MDRTALKHCSFTTFNLQYFTGDKSGHSVVAIRLQVVVVVVVVVMAMVIVTMMVVVVEVVMVTPDPLLERGLAVPDSRLLNMLVVVSIAPAGRDTARVTGTTRYPHQRQSVSQCCHSQ